jgi:hypothetical protein
MSPATQLALCYKAHRRSLNGVVAYAFGKACEATNRAERDYSVYPSVENRQQLDACRERENQLLKVM